MGIEMRAIIKKDISGITANKRMFSALLIVPFVLMVFVPTIFILILHFAPDEMGDFEKLLEMIPLESREVNLNTVVIALLLNYILPVFFLIIPVMVSSIMAASSFIGEKEKRTLETLLYCPLSLRQIFQAKVMASFLLMFHVSTDYLLGLENGAVLCMDGLSDREVAAVRELVDCLHARK